MSPEVPRSDVTTKTATHAKVTTAAKAAPKQKVPRQALPKGRSGNPAGKAQGTRHRVTIMAEQEGCRPTSKPWLRRSSKKPRPVTWRLPD